MRPQIRRTAFVSSRRASRDRFSVRDIPEDDRAQPNPTAPPDSYARIHDRAQADEGAVVDLNASAHGDIGADGDVISENRIVRDHRALKYQHVHSHGAVAGTKAAGEYNRSGTQKTSFRDDRRRMNDDRQPLRAHVGEGVKGQANFLADEEVPIIGHADRNLAAPVRRLRENRGGSEHRIIEYRGSRESRIVVYKPEDVPSSAIFVDRFKTLQQIARGAADAIDDDVVYRQTGTSCSTNVMRASATVRI